ncbi:MAG: hypothetical protein ACLFPQ_05875 [Candidatus Woesearchaeota archaeon]
MVLSGTGLELEVRYYPENHPKTHGPVLEDMISSLSRQFNDSIYDRIAGELWTEQFRFYRENSELMEFNSYPRDELFVDPVMEDLMALESAALIANQDISLLTGKKHYVSGHSIHFNFEFLPPSELIYDNYDSLVEFDGSCSEVMLDHVIKNYQNLLHLFSKPFVLSLGSYLFASGNNTPRQMGSKTKQSCVSFCEEDLFEYFRLRKSSRRMEFDIDYFSDKDQMRAGMSWMFGILLGLSTEIDCFCMDDPRLFSEDFSVLYSGLMRYMRSKHDSIVLDPYEDEVMNFYPRFFDPHNPKNPRMDIPVLGKNNDFCLDYETLFENLSHDYEDYFRQTGSDMELVCDFISGKRFTEYEKRVSGKGIYNNIPAMDIDHGKHNEIVISKKKPIDFLSSYEAGSDIPKNIRYLMDFSGQNNGMNFELFDWTGVRCENLDDDFLDVVSGYIPENKKDSFRDQKRYGDGRIVLPHQVFKGVCDDYLI